MKIYISLPIESNETKLSSFLEGVSHLKKLGHNILETGRNNTKTKDNTFKYFTHSEKSIKDADIVIAEVSEVDGKIGYEIAKTVSEKKLVIALENEIAKSKQNPIIHGNSSKNIIYQKYNKSNIVKILDNSLKEASKRLDSKFILIISPEIDRYLDWSSQNKRMHKAQVVRTALENAMKKDRDYQESLKN